MAKFIVLYYESRIFCEFLVFLYSKLIKGRTDMFISIFEFLNIEFLNMLMKNKKNTSSVDTII